MKGDAVVIHFNFQKDIKPFKAIIERIQDNLWHGAGGIITYRRIDNNTVSFCDQCYIKEILKQIPGEAVAVVEGNQRI